MTCPSLLIRWWRHLRFVWPWGHDAIAERARIREDARRHYRNPHQGYTQ